MFCSKIVSSQVRVFPEASIEELCESVSFRVFKNEPVSFQLAFKLTNKYDYMPISVGVYVDGEMKLPVSAYKVAYVPITRTSFNFSEVASEERGVGLYPDMLLPRPSMPVIVANTSGNIIYREKDVDDQLSALGDSAESVWFTVNEDGVSLEQGEYTLCVRVTSLLDGKLIEEKRVKLEINGLELPKNELIYTNWFYCDCLADIYGVELYSERFFEIFSDQVKNAARHSMNTLLLPAFTPPLDTPVGDERKNTALVGVKRENGRYSFDFTLLERYVKLALDAGIEYFEHIPMYTQWGAGHAPSIYAYENGELKRIFGWETDSSGEEYKAFLKSYIDALKCELERLGIGDKIIYHVSDEPNADTLESFGAVADYFYSLIGDAKCIDALSEIEYYKRGLVRTPVVSLDKAEDFMAEDAPMLLYYTCGYYAGGYLDKCSNRLITSKPYRTRIIGTQLYRYGALGFLHWGYNYYYDRMSVGLFDPALDPCGYKQMPGCSYLVYPARGGRACPSMREKYMCEAMTDHRKLTLLCKLTSRESVCKLCDSYFGERVTVTTIPSSASEMTDFAELLYDEILRAAK